MDIDMLGKALNDPHSLSGIVKNVIATDLEPDGLSFNPNSVTAVSIAADAQYKGVRINFIGHLGNARIYMQIDFGFGDVIYPRPQLIAIPSILDFPRANLLGYSRETLISEKFEAMVNLGDLNSRMKDFFDIWTLCRQCDFDGETLAEAIRRTFRQRETEIPEKARCFSEEFTEKKQAHWRTFHKRIKREDIPADFREIVTEVQRFLEPVASAVRDGHPVSMEWSAAGTWK